MADGAELVSYETGPELVVVSLAGDDLVFRASFEDFGRTQVSETRLRATDFVARGPDPYPWYDLGARRDGALRVLDALGAGRPEWSTPLPALDLELFDCAAAGSDRVGALLAGGAAADPVDPCGASPLWYAVRSRSARVPVLLIDAGADAGRRIGLSAGGDRFTTILHEIVRRGLTVALRHALDRGADAAAADSDGATPLHVIEGDVDHVGPELVRALAGAGAAVDAASAGGAQPVELAARRLLPATTAALVELGASPDRGLDALLGWWATGATFAGYRAGVVAGLVELLCAGGATPTDRHRELAAWAGGGQVADALDG